MIPIFCREKDNLWQKTDKLSFQQKLLSTDKWLDDSKVTHCLGCNAEFTFTLRKVTKTSIGLAL